MARAKTDAPIAVSDADTVLKGTAATVLITIGHYVRKHDDDTPVAKMTVSEGDTFKNVMDAWGTEIGAIDTGQYVYGAGENGIFTDTVAHQAGQLASMENSWGISFGLGCVNFASGYPAYDLGEFEAAPKALCADFDIGEWWSFVSTLNSGGADTLTNIIKNAIDTGCRVVFAMGGQNYSLIYDELVNLTGPNGAIPVDDVYGHVRFVGANLGKVIPGKLLPCVMPFDSEALDTIVPGSRASGARRMAALLAAVSPVPKGGKTNPRKDAEKIQDALDNANEIDAVVFDDGGRSGSVVREKLSDDDLAKEVSRCLHLVRPDAAIITRMIRDNGYSVTVERVTTALESIVKDTGDNARTAETTKTTATKGKAKK